MQSEKCWGRYKTWLAVLAFTLVATSTLVTRPAAADELFVVVEYRCDMKTDRLILEYKGVWTSESSKTLPQLGPDTWNPWDLVSLDDDGNIITAIHPVHRTCLLSDGTYAVTVGPEPGNMNLQSQCGASMTAWAEIKKDAQTLVRRRFEGWCLGDDPVTRSIEIYAGSDVPRIRTEAHDAFYGIKP